MFQLDRQPCAAEQTKRLFGNKHSIAIDARGVGGRIDLPAARLINRQRITFRREEFLWFNAPGLIVHIGGFESDELRFAVGRCRFNFDARQQEIAIRITTGAAFGQTFIRHRFQS